MKDFLRKSVLGISIVPLKKDHSNKPKEPTIADGPPQDEDGEPFEVFAEDIIKAIHNNSPADLASALQAFMESCPRDQEEEEEEPGKPRDY